VAQPLQPGNLYFFSTSSIFRVIRRHSGRLSGPGTRRAGRAHGGRFLSAKAGNSSPRLDEWDLQPAIIPLRIFYFFAI
jgi:hypothetical protein